jgi:carbohydrate diacid regulator
MISNQIIKNSIEKLKAITKIDFSVRNMEGYVVASTERNEELPLDTVQQFASSPADSQEVQGFHFFKVTGEDVPEYILIARGAGEDVHMIGRICVSQLQDLIAAYKERFDKNNFIQNLLLDNLLLVDIYNRAKKLHIEPQERRIVYIIETRHEKDNAAMEVVRNMFADEEGNFITEVDEKSIILVQGIRENTGYEDIVDTAKEIQDTLNTEAMTDVRVACGTIVTEIAQVSRSYKEARMALNVGKIFYTAKRIHMYNTLGIGRLIYQLPENLCRLFIREVFTKQQPDSFDEETITTINMFFDNNLNVSETARQLFVHRNTLVYRLEKLYKATGLDIRVFDDALTFKIALMVESYLRYLEENQE